MNNTLRTALYAVGIIALARWAARSVPGLAPLGRVV